jgi:hypothetical protein
MQRAHTATPRIKSFAQIPLVLRGIMRIYIAQVVKTFYARRVARIITLAKGEVDWESEGIWLISRFFGGGAHPRRLSILHPTDREVRAGTLGN